MRLECAGIRRAEIAERLEISEAAVAFWSVSGARPGQPLQLAE